MMNKNNLGDIHMGEATRFLCEEVIYKPRDAQTEKAWEAFLLSLEEAGLRHLPGFVNVLRETENGHEEEVVCHTDTDQKGLQEYYRSCGCLLCLAWILGASDFHGENLIAFGNKPVLIDLETLMSGTEARQSEWHDLTLAGSVTRTHLLPHFEGYEDASGFSGKNGQNVPSVDGNPAEIAQYESELLEGFEEAFRFTLSHKEYISKQISLFDNCHFRIMLRPTSTYCKMLDILNSIPKSEKEATADHILRKAYEMDADPNRIHIAERSLKAETYSLIQGWIPLFYAHGNGTALYCDGRQLGLEYGEQKVMDSFYRLSPVETAKARIRRLDEVELKKQMAIIQTVLHSKEQLLPDKGHEDWKKALLSVLKKEQIPNLPGNYIQLTEDNGRGIWTSGGFTLYEGAAGILCSLAAMGQEDGPLFKKLYQDLETYVLRSSTEFRLNGDACALGSGVSGIIAALIHISDLTGKLQYQDEAYTLLERFEEVVAQGAETDILGGLAGLCLQLPKLKGEKPKRLARILMPEMIRANTKLTGAGHGKAGLALALGALQYTLGTDEADARILQQLREEEALFIPERNNWPDLRREGRAGFMGGWCSGAPGIGMYRKKLMEYTANLEILELCRRDISNAEVYLEEHRNKELQRDTLCCGNAARLMAASYLGVELPELKKTITRSVDPASPRLFHLVNTADHQFSLMQGVSGVGYALALYGDDKSGGMLR